MSRDTNFWQIVNNPLISPSTSIYQKDVHIAFVNNEINARLIIKAVNSYDEHIRLLKIALERINSEYCSKHEADGYCDYCREFELALKESE